MPRRHHCVFASTGTEQRKWADWLWETIPNSSREKAAEKIVSVWSKQDTLAAGDWIAALGDHRLWDKARIAYARSVYKDYPDAALAWAARVSPGQGRLDLARDIYRDWQKSDATAAEDWLAESTFESVEKSWLRGSLTE